MFLSIPDALDYSEVQRKTIFLEEVLSVWGRLKRREGRAWEGRKEGRRA